MQNSCEELKAFTRDSGTVPLKLAERVVGRAGRVAQIVPEARPFAGALWTALTAAKKANDSGPKEAPPGKAAVRRFTVASRWMTLLLRQDPEAPFILRREVLARGPKPASRSSWTIEFDASIYGGGAVLKHGDTLHEFFIKEWCNEDVAHLKVWRDDPAHQTFWEYLMVLMSLIRWGHQFVHEEVAILGDNTGALQNAVSLKGKGELMAIAREISWRQAREKWAFSVGHLPSEHNVVADSLSRRYDPDPLPLPTCLRNATQVSAPSVRLLWKLRKAI